MPYTPPDETLRCTFCFTHFETQKGLDLHLVHKAVCRNAFHRKLRRDQQTHPSSSRRLCPQDPSLAVSAKIGDQAHDEDYPPTFDDSPGLSLSAHIDVQAQNPSADIGSSQDAPESRPSKRQRSSENISDWDTHGIRPAYWVEHFPAAKEAGKSFGRAETPFERRQQETLCDPWRPFKNEGEWKLAQWMLKTLGHKQTDDFLKLELIKGLKLSFKNNRTFRKSIDKVPTGPKWYKSTVKIEGNVKDANGNLKCETAELHYRDITECVRELIGDTTLKDHLVYEPRRIYEDMRREKRVYEGMETCDWWWEMQSKLDAGATIAPLIIASDKTPLSTHCGDKEVWPVYISLGNIDFEKRRSPSAHATILLAYITISPLLCYTPERRSDEKCRLFHDCMKKIFRPIVEAGRSGTMMTCADGLLRLVYPILAAYIADQPEQCLLVPCRQNRCPRCTVPPDQQEVLSSPEHPDGWPNRTLTEHFAALALAQRGDLRRATDLGIRNVKPFWLDLPHTEIFSCITPDLLHQLHKGVFGQHVFNWASNAATISHKELDLRFQAIPPHPALRNFSQGISTITHWNGKEYKKMAEVFVGVIAKVVDPRVYDAVRALLDFMNYASLESHTEDTLAKLDRALIELHDKKSIFIELGIRDNFNFPKFHSLLHYSSSIRLLGSLPAYNSEGPERLHIDLAKSAYRASNKKDFLIQMTTWLQRRDAVYKFNCYHEWRSSMLKPAHASHRLPCDNAEDASSESLSEDEDDDDGGGEHDYESDCGTVKQPETADSLINSRIRIAIKPAYSGLSIQTILDDFKADHFLYHLDQFLRRRHPSKSFSLAETDTFDAFKQLTLELPVPRTVSRTPKVLKDVIRAMRSDGAKRPPIFDMVLARDPAVNTDEPYALKNLRVGRVRLLFRLPASYCVEQPNNVLAFIEWFTPIRDPDPELRLHQVNVSYRNHRRNASIIPADDIVQSIHLLPVFPASMETAGWSSCDVYDLADKFFINPFTRLHDFMRLENVCALP